MLGIYIAMFGALMMVIHLCLVEPTAIERDAEAAADVAALNFWNYRDAIINVKYANAITVDGPIPENLATFPVGYVGSDSWGNLVQGGTLYMYSKAPVGPTVIDRIMERGGRSLMIGTVNNYHQMISYGADYSASFNIPASIAVGSIVVIGE